MNRNYIPVHWVALHEQFGLGAPIAGNAQYERLLACLMEQYGPWQSDLSEIGPHRVVSAVLAGKRELDLRQVKLPAARFHVPMEAPAG